MSQNDSYTLTWSWAQLQAELDRLALGPAQASLIPYLVRPLQDQARFLNGELMLREILSLAACVADNSFPPAVLKSVDSDPSSDLASSRP